MYVFALLALPPSALLAVMGLAWLEEHLLPPPAGPARPGPKAAVAPAAPAVPQGGALASGSGTAPPGRPGSN